MRRLAVLSIATIKEVFSKPLPRWIAGASAVAVIVIVVGLFMLGRGGCWSRNDVTARVSVASSGLQQAAAQNKITIEQLATGIRRLNAAATSYETTKDHQAYCDALDGLMEEYTLD